MLELVGVTKQYLYGARVLGAVDLSVKAGEILAVLGGEGSGKTTLLKVAAAVTDCEGDVLVDGAPMAKRPDDVLMVFDDLAVFGNRSFRYNLSYPLSIRGVAKNEINNRVEYASQRMGIVACLSMKAKRASLIDLKRLALARLFIRQYKVLLVDDITSGLSRDEADELWSETMPILIEKAREGVAVVFATSSEKEAFSIADRIAVMHAGDLKQVGMASELLETPSNIWAAQAADRFFRFERGNISEDGKTLTLGVKTPTDDADEFEIGIEDLKIPPAYLGKTVFAGWHSSDFDTTGGREKKVDFAVFEDGKYTLHAGEFCVRAENKLERVGTLPKKGKVMLFDFASENSILL